MKKHIAVILALSLAMAISSCDNNVTIPGIRPESPSISTESACGLVNKMTDYERANAFRHELTTLNRSGSGSVFVGIGNVTVSKEVTLSRLEESKRLMSDEEYNNALQNAKEYTYTEALINGVRFSGYIPPLDYNGGAFSACGTDFAGQSEYFEWLENEYCRNMGYTSAETSLYVRESKAVFEAVLKNNYTKLPDRNETYSSTYFSEAADPFQDYRARWKFDRKALEGIRDQIDEYNIYDEELGIDFLVHVTRPPEYDENKTYPVMFMTDAVLRLGDHPALYEAMKNGEAAPVILVSLGVNYNIDGTNDGIRWNLFIHERQRIVDFITDNLMPYLGENYRIDCENSTLFGHSMGGVLSHCALYTSDLYENQPFGKYIIASPAFWNLYNDRFSADLHPECTDDDYGFYDRNETTGKKVFVCAGFLEDKDYAEQYNGHDSALTGTQKVNDHLARHKADVTFKLYESHNSQYVSGMLKEYLKKTYPNGENKTEETAGD